MLRLVREVGDRGEAGRSRVETRKVDSKDILGKVFGFEGFRPGQERVVGALLGEPPGSALAVFPTGGGKSLTYQLPALILGEAGEGVTVVVSPLVSLMKDQISFLRSRNIAAARLDSSLSREEYREVEASLEDGSLRLLYV
jgi:ATP-dependent DNA helicase RecQ